MRAVLALLGFLMVFAAAPGIATAQRPPLAVGQVWMFKDANAQTARVVIQKIEQWRKGGEAVHISLYGLASTPRFNGIVEHLPFERTALEASLVQLTDETPPDDLDFNGGYKTWQDARGGIFTITVAEVVEIVVGRLLAAPQAHAI
jgi:hypothetical protein